MSDNSLELLFPVGVDIVDLPSEGKFYPKDHPLCDQKVVELLHMRGADEDILTNRDYIKRNLVVDKLLKNLLKDSKMKLDKNFNNLLIADEFMMLLKARITAYTWEYPTTVKCPSCGKNSLFTFDLRQWKVLQPDLESMEDVVYNEDDNTFTVTLPILDIKFVVKPLTVDIQKKIATKALNKQNKILSTKDKLEDSIVSINDNPSQEMKVEFFKNAPPLYIKWLENTIDDLNVRISLEQQFECEHCDYTEMTSPPFTSDFLLNPKVKKEKQ